MEKYTKKDETVFIRLSNTETIRGKINVIGFDRASDSIINNDEWVIVYDAVVNGGGGNDLLINKSHIVYIMLDNEK